MKVILCFWYLFYQLSLLYTSSITSQKIRAKIGSNPILGKIISSAKKLWKCLERLIVIRLNDIWLNKIVFQGIHVKSDLENSKAHENKRLFT